MLVIVGVAQHGPSEQVRNWGVHEQLLTTEPDNEIKRGVDPVCWDCESEQHPGQSLGWLMGNAMLCVYCDSAYKGRLIRCLYLLFAKQCPYWAMNIYILCWNSFPYHPMTAFCVKSSKLQMLLKLSDFSLLLDYLFTNCFFFNEWTVSVLLSSVNKYIT